MLTRLRTNLLDLKHHAGFAKFARWIMKTRNSQYGFALSIHSDVRTKPQRLRHIPTSLHRCIPTSHVILYWMKTNLHKCSLTLRHIGHTRTNMNFSNVRKHCYNSLMLLFTKYKCTWLTAISMSLSRCITCHDVYVQQSHATKRLLPWYKVNFWRFVAMLLLCSKDQ